MANGKTRNSTKHVLGFSPYDAEAKGAGLIDYDRLSIDADPVSTFVEPPFMVVKWRKDPSILGIAPVPLRYDCKFAAHLSGSTGSHGREGFMGANHGGGGAHGAHGGDGRDGGAVSVSVSLGNSPYDDSEVLLVSIWAHGEEVRKVVATDGGSLAILARGGAGGSGGRGGVGGPHGDRYEGGSGGDGGDGGDGGRGGTIRVRVSPDAYDAFQRVVTLDNRGGAGGYGGAGGSAASNADGSFTAVAGRDGKQGRIGPDGPPPEVVTGRVQLDWASS